MQCKLKSAFSVANVLHKKGFETSEIRPCEHLSFFPPLRWMLEEWKGNLFSKFLSEASIKDCHNEAAPFIQKTRGGKSELFLMIQSLDMTSKYLRYPLFAEEIRCREFRTLYLAATEFLES